MVEACKKLLALLEEVTDLEELESIKTQLQQVIYYYDDDGK